jgi:hypothetical protein
LLCFFAVLFVQPVINGAAVTPLVLVAVTRRGAVCASGPQLARPRNLSARGPVLFVEHGPLFPRLLFVMAAPRTRAHAAQVPEVPGHRRTGFPFMPCCRVRSAKLPALRAGSLHRPPLLHHLSRFFCGGVGADRARLLPGTVALSTRTGKLVVKGDLRGVVDQVARDVATCSGTSQPAKTVCVVRDGPHRAHGANADVERSKGRVRRPGLVSAVGPAAWDR